jgi:hypothetical protein
VKSQISHDLEKRDSIGRYDSPRVPCPYDYSNDCDCYTCRSDRAASNSGGSQRYEKYKASYDRDTGLNQTNFFAGTVGERDQRKKVHVAINELGDVVYVRDEDGTVLYDRKHNIGHLPSDLNWSRF